MSTDVNTDHSTDDNADICILMKEVGMDVRTYMGSFWDLMPIKGSGFS